MRVLIAGSRDFNAGYRIDRALRRAMHGHRNHEMTLVTLNLPSGRMRRGADGIARDIVGQFGWERERVSSVSMAQADLCLAFLCHEDPHDDMSRITAMKAEKAGIPTWRYYEGGPRAGHDEPMSMEGMYTTPASLADWEWDLLGDSPVYYTEAVDPLQETL